MYIGNIQQLILFQFLTWTIKMITVYFILIRYEDVFVFNGIIPKSTRIKGFIPLSKIIITLNFFYSPNNDIKAFVQLNSTNKTFKSARIQLRFDRGFFNLLSFGFMCSYDVIGVNS